MAAPVKVYTGTCDTMTFEEAWEAIANGRLFTAVLRREKNGNVGILPVFVIEATNRVIQLTSDRITLYWTTDGISSVAPSSGES